ncbi:MAG: glycosyltransferase family 4 protein [Actinomycetota bacterium]|nr:glycosyltransferase family 4 protein [Actinomycetota bacterium]
MRVQIVDPSAQTPPFDRSLAAALARAGADVELLTAPFVHGEVAEPVGYRVTDFFYPRSSRLASGSVARRVLGLAEHVPGMLRARLAAEGADVVHYQWLTLPALDATLLPRNPAKVWTAHGFLRASESAGPGSLEGSRRALERMDAIVALSEFGAQRLREAGVAAERVEVIPHGAFDYLAELPARPLPAELEGAEGPVILLFGLLRPYKGADVLLRAFAELGESAELWIAGRPLGVDTAELRRLAAQAPGRVRFVERFITDSGIPAIMRRADIVTLPYRDAEQSGVLYTALAFGKPIVASNVGGFGEVAEVAGEGTETIRLVPPGNHEALAEALGALLSDEAARERLGRAAADAAAGPYSWDTVAERTLALYRRLSR